MLPNPSADRIPMDFYETPPALTRVLLDRVEVGGVVYEPCNGLGAISHLLAATEPVTRLVTNDLDAAKVADTHFDATTPAAWGGSYDWVVSNPPYRSAEAIIPRAYDAARVGVAMLLRLSYLEPARGRAAWLQAHPPTTAIIVAPRPRFRPDKPKDNDSVTSAWFVWRRTPPEPSRGTILEFVAGWDPDR